jgi:uncharacterized YigZ family protein
MTGRSIKIVASPGEGVLEIRRSRFLAFVHACDSREEAERLLEHLRHAHPKATHHVWAWRLLEPGTAAIRERCDDDGEPGGTAGRPTLQALQARAVVNALAVTVRYFGGIKLGAGGLTRAYGNAANAALSAAVLQEHVPRVLLRVRIPFPLLNVVEAQLARARIPVLARRFDPSPELVCEVSRASVADLELELREVSGGQALLDELDPSGGGLT